MAVTSAGFIPFSKAPTAPNELAFLARALTSGSTAGGGPFSKVCEAWVEQETGCNRALLTHSCTAALEMAALLLDIAAGDEIIMPSWTFASTANAFMLRGGIPVFIDVDADTLNIDPALVELAITPKTRAICVVHYAGVACDMDALVRIAIDHGIALIEDAAQAIGSDYRGHPLGSLGQLGAFSFHATKNISSGEGGALAINSTEHVARAEILREKGTDRSRFMRGETDKYTWRDIGSSFLPSELTAAVLAAQFEIADTILKNRLKLWNAYQDGLVSLDPNQRLTRPRIPSHCKQNGHIYHIRTSGPDERDTLLTKFREHAIGATFHYSPLHSSPAGITHGRTASSMAVTDAAANTLLRLPMWDGMSENDIDRILTVIDDFVRSS